MPSKKSSHSSRSSKSTSSESEWIYKKRHYGKKCKKRSKCKPKYEYQFATNWSYDAAYLSIYGKKAQVLNISDPVVFEFIQIAKNICFAPDTSKITITQDGVYSFHATIVPNEPSQFTLFVNGVPLASATIGTNSAGINLVITQILELKCGDVLELLNYTSAVNGGTITIPTSIGGVIPASSTNVDLSIFKIDGSKCEYPKHKVYEKCEKKCD